MSQVLQAGFATIDITPPLGVYLAGHFNARPSHGIHDPLTAQAIVFDLGAQRLALVGCDLVGIPGELTPGARCLLLKVWPFFGRSHLEPAQVCAAGARTPNDGSVPGPRTRFAKGV